MNSEDLIKRDLIQVCQTDLEHLSNEELVKYALHLKDKLLLEESINSMLTKEIKDSNDFISSINTLLKLYNKTKH